ncbi:MAG TPA: 6-bladed beta-propeller [Candidatus Saccharicenans sp.]|nr:6-bladed beta-propeller [Candidatus Saccharicenans sp.]HQM75330.1 6-bladed beta-propeller [Candidatus Saccharicenans sp.]
MKKLVTRLLLMASLTFSTGGIWLGAQNITHSTAIESELKGVKDRPFFYRPVAMVLNGQELYLLESGDNRIRVFSLEGTQLREIGRKGNGPGEFDSPSCLDVNHGEIYVADTFNSRIQIFSKEGKNLAAFKLPAFPENIVSLSGGALVVSFPVRNLDGPEKLLYGYKTDGTRLWAILDSQASGDRVYDSFCNQIFLKKGEADTFYVIWRYNNRYIFKIDSRGQIVKKIKIDADYPVKTINLPGKGKRVLEGVCWNVDIANHNFYLISMEEMADKDVGPGKKVIVLNEEGNITGIIDFPLAVKKLAVNGNQIYALDTEDELHLFKLNIK